MTAFLVATVTSCQLMGGNSFRLTATVVADGFAFPTSMVEVDGRLLVGERGGIIRYTDDRTPLIDLSPVIGEVAGEQGLYALALHPHDGRLFVSHSDERDGATVVTAFSLPDAEVGSEVIRVPQPDSRHNGGGMAFGPDSYLYLGLGDGGPGDDPQREGQNPNTLLGTILRLNVNEPAGYAVPDDNPFVEGGGAPEVWAYGLRNPWRLSVDPETGDLWIGDVGQNRQEEINVAPAGVGGLNFGWSEYEGTVCFREDECDRTGLTMPAIAYENPDDASRAVVGGYVYRGSAFPQLRGQYVYTDTYSGEVLTVDASLERSPRVVLTGEWIVTSLAEDASGELYLLSFEDGLIYRLGVSP